MKNSKVSITIEKGREGVRALYRALQRSSSKGLVVKSVTLVAVTALLFNQDLAIIFTNALHGETTNYMLAIPAMLAYLLYRKRKILRIVTSVEERSFEKKHYLSTFAGILLSIAAVVLCWFGSYTFSPIEYHMFSVPIFVAGLTLILFNPETLRQLAFPIVLLLFFVPPPSQTLASIGSTLSILSSEASNLIVNVLGVPATLVMDYGNPTIIVTRANGVAIPFIVDIACSGIYSLIGFVVFAVFVAYIIRDKPWKKAALFVVGLPLIYLLNVFRITIILLIGYHLGEQLALQIFHLLGGWTLIFLGTLILLAISDKLLKTQLFTTPKPSHEKCINIDEYQNNSYCLSCGEILKPLHSILSKTDVAKATIIILSVILVISIQAPVFALTESPAIVIINTPLGEQYSTDILPEIEGYKLDFVYRDRAFEETSKQDMSLIYGYTPENTSQHQIWVSIEIASTTGRLHTWEKCLITWPITHGSQPKVTQLDLKDVQILDNPPIIARHFVFRYKTTNVTQAVLYWFETTYFNVNATSQLKHTKISLIAYPNMLGDIPELQSNLEEIGAAIAEYWQPIKIWSELALVLSQNGDELFVGAMAALSGLVIFIGISNRLERTRNFKVYKKLSTPNKQIVDAIRRTENSGIPTLNRILDTYNDSTEEFPRQKDFAKSIIDLASTGIVRGSVSNRNDEPVQVWRTRIAFK